MRCAVRTFVRVQLDMKVPAPASHRPGFGRLVGVDMSQRTCSVDGCERDIRSRGYCYGHYKRWAKGGPVDAKPLPPARKCSVADCANDHYQKGFCILHFSRWQVHGSTEKPVTVSKTVERDARVVEMLKQGVSYDEIVEQTGIGRTFISTLASRNGMSQRVRGRICSLDGCDRPNSSGGFCRLHSERLKRTGTTDPRQTFGISRAERYKQWCQENPDSMRRSAKKWRANNPEKRRAHRRVEVAIKFGRMTRMPCEVCGDAKSHAHHDDYSKPLDVIWLCHSHHMAHHKMLRDQQRDPDAA